jgi:hypothetical protein
MTMLRTVPVVFDRWLRCLIARVEMVCVTGLLYLASYSRFFHGRLRLTQMAECKSPAAAVQDLERRTEDSLSESAPLMTE